MGFPMNRYSLLSKLMRKDSGRSGGIDALYEEEAKNIPQMFSLYAFALCDHEDKVFRNCMTNLFSDLDRHTGKNLLFTALVKPDSDVSYTLKKHYNVKGALTAMSQYTIDDDLYQYALLEAFQMSSADLPAIVLTTSLESAQWYVIPVADAPQCVQWLSALRGYADDLADNFPVCIEDVLDNLSSQNTGGRWFAVEGAPICDLLSAIEAAVAFLKSRGRDIVEEKAYARMVFGEVCDRLVNFNSDGERRAAVVSFVKYLQALTLDSGMSHCRVPHCHDLRIRRSHMLECETLRYVKMFQILNDSSELRKMEDQTVLCSLLHKIFESEINASLLQLMRRHIRIPMPEFYCRFFPDRKDCYVNDVNLNRYINGNPKKHVSPGLGKVCWAFNVLSEEQEFCESLARFGISDCGRRTLVELWTLICDIRNMEAHCQMMTEEHYHMMYDAVAYVMDEYMQSLYGIKKELRP